MNFYNKKIQDLYRLILEEESQLYGMYQSRKKLVNTILADKVNFTIFINEFVYNSIYKTSKTLERVDASLNMKRDNLKEPDFIYKTNDEKIYYILEHQTVVDKEIIYRMLNYTINLFNQIKQMNIDNDKYIQLPQIIPIVFYTGEEKWDSPVKVEDIQHELSKDNIILAFKYILININDYMEDDLLKKKCIISYMMFLEKNRYANEPIKILDKIFKSCKSKEEIEEVVILVKDFFTPILGKEITKELISKNCKNIINK